MVFHNFLNFILSKVSFLFKINKKSIAIMHKGYSGSNLSPIYEKLNQNKYNSYKINLVYDTNNTKRFLNGKTNKIGFYKNIVKKNLIILKSNLILSTHITRRYRKKTKMINLWHGIPIKTMALMNKSSRDRLNAIEDDYFISTSVFFNTIMNSCMGLTADKYIITGYPRNDYLFDEDGISNLEKLLDMKINDRILLYMPTYRYDREKFSNIFDFEEFDFDEFIKYLEENNLILLLKLHPIEEKMLLDRINKYIGERILLITNDDLERGKMDFYKIVNAADLLITDYSSIYFDYLLLDRPIVFTPSDLEHYRSNRGLLLEPYDYWTPGPKCFNQKSLHEEILKSIDNVDYYKEKRKELKDIFHKYQDNGSTNRVMKLIEEIMEEN